jgi:hypothetical protein
VAVELEDEDDEVTDSESECMSFSPVQQKRKQKRPVKPASSRAKPESKVTVVSKGKAFDPSMDFRSKASFPPQRNQLR